VIPHRLDGRGVGHPKSGLQHAGRKTVQARWSWSCSDLGQKLKRSSKRRELGVGSRTM
jgi:hypothetical protein